MLRAALFRAGIAIAGFGLVAWIASLWVVSYQRGRGPAARTIALWQGELTIGNMPNYFGPGLRCLNRVPSPGQLTRLRWWPDDGWFRVYPVGGVRLWSLHVPLWMPTAAGLLLSATQFGAWRHG